MNKFEAWAKFRKQTVNHRECRYTGFQASTISQSGSEVKTYTHTYCDYWDTGNCKYPGNCEWKYVKDYYIKVRKRDKENVNGLQPV